MRYGIRQSCLPPLNGLPVVLRNRGMGELLQKTFDKEGDFEYISHPAAVERPIRAHLRRDLAQFCDLVEVGKDASKEFGRTSSIIMTPFWRRTAVALRKSRRVCSKVCRPSR